jgi:hypothetical protein
MQCPNAANADNVRNMVISFIRVTSFTRHANHRSGHAAVLVLAPRVGKDGKHAVACTLGNGKSLMTTMPRTRRKERRLSKTESHVIPAIQKL